MVTVTVTEPSEITFDDQAIGVDTDDEAAVAATGVTLPENSSIVVTDDEGTVVGMASPDEAVDDDTVVVNVDSSAGEHTAHIIPDAGISENTTADGVVSEETAANVVTADTAVVYDADLTFEDQQFDDALAVGSTDLSIANTQLINGGVGVSQFTVDVHPTTEEGNIIGNESAGQTTDLSANIGLSGVAWS